MKLKYRNNNNSMWEWKYIDSENIDWNLLLRNKYSSITFKLDCIHGNYKISNGEKICKDCGTTLEVTSYRD